MAEFIVRSRLGKSKPTEDKDQNGREATITRSDFHGSKSTAINKYGNEDYANSG